MIISLCSVPHLPLSQHENSIGCVAALAAVGAGEFGRTRQYRTSASAMETWRAETGPEQAWLREQHESADSGHVRGRRPYLGNTGGGCLTSFALYSPLRFTLEQGPRMTDCTVSVVGGDGQTHTVEVQASSLFDAVDQAAQQWARLWWYRGEAVVEVRAGERCWQVRLERVRVWRGNRAAPVFLDSRT